MKNAITIRKYKAEDRDQVLSIFKNNVPNFFAETEVQDFENYLDNEVQDYYVTLLDNNIIAAAGINYDKVKQIAKISWDIVDTAYQKQGIGSLLLQHRLKVIERKKDIKSIIVRTSQHASEFYEKLGFKLLERHKDYWAPGFDMHKMIYKAS